MLLRTLRAVALSAPVVLGLGTCGCATTATTPSGPPTTSATWTFQIGSSCAGKLNSAVSIYVDDVYRGQTQGQLSVSVSPGSHMYAAFTTDHVHQWGPNEVSIGSEGVILTLDCQ